MLTGWYKDICVAWTVGVEPPYELGIEKLAKTLDPVNVTENASDL